MTHAHPAVRILMLCIVFLLPWSGTPSALAQEPAPRDIDAQLRALMAQHDTVGLAVVVVRDDAVVYRNSLGWKDAEERIPLAQDDLFRIASISKSFAATAILQLVEQRRLSLDDDVGELIGFPVRNPAHPQQAITLRMLLNHTSSIVDGERYNHLDLINPRAGGDWRSHYAARAPGAQYEYSNLGYNMVGTIVERVSGERFDAYIQSHVLAPLGLHGGYAPETLDADRFAQIYRWREDDSDGKTTRLVRSDLAYAPLGKRLDGYAMGYDTPMFSPTGGLKISASDLAAYMRMHMRFGELDGTRILSADHARAMQTSSVDADEGAGYGLALRIERALIPGVELVGHTGSAYGLFSSMFFDPARGYGFVVITNGTRDMEVRTAVNRALYRHFIVDAAEVMADD